MTTSPYNLKSRTENPVQFYNDLSEYTAKVIKKGSSDLKQYIDEYLDFTQVNKSKKYSSNEYLIELLMAGIYWRNYHKKLSIDAIFFRPLFSQLYSLRKKYSSIKTRVDSYRGRLGHKLLSSDKNKDIKIYERFEYLISWLDCTKEYNQEVERLEKWKIFLENKHVDYQNNFWNKIEAFAEWFETESEYNLGAYTQNWSEFMMDSTQHYTGKENYFFCTRLPNEYHLNMVAAEVMNNALKANYQKADKKIVLLPTCMVKSENCQAKMDRKNMVCQHCNENCSVSKLKTDLNKKGVDTVLIPHSSSFSKYLKPWENSTDTALIGVACTLNLITGGYEMQKLNIPSQCVFLDSCGCKKHWLSGEPTNLNKTQLNNLILANDSVKQPVNSTC
ncbi:MAG: DUF116 domain-containing protein [Salinivirgaceae bacterium]|jgi:hypothetical protein|nr:DUF116 domain-containing protein [Salinivirgaceae bacterium]